MALTESVKGTNKSFFTFNGNLFRVQIQWHTSASIEAFLLIARNALPYRAMQQGVKTPFFAK